MKNYKTILGVLGMVLALGVLAGCATGSSIGGTSDPHGLISSAYAVTDGAAEIASYSVILGLLDTGYPSYVDTVKAAEASGKQVTSVTTQYLGFFTKITAYAK
jgi:hypothetical protein